MIPIVRSLEEAENFFRENHSGSVCCINTDGAEKECSCYPEAVAFFTK